jgi:transcriptional regulator with XRE-family HTH domain
MFTEKGKGNSIDKDLSNLLSKMNFENEEQKFNHDSYILMAGYLSEIELILKKYNINKKTLASKINCTPPYITQVFRGNKPLNFYTLAKIKNALNIRFEVRAIDLKEKFIKEKQEYFPISTFDLSQKDKDMAELSYLLDSSKTIRADQVNTTYSSKVGGQ